MMSLSIWVMSARLGSGTSTTEISFSSSSGIFRVGATMNRVVYEVLSA